MTDLNPICPDQPHFRKCLQGHVPYSISFDGCPSCKLVAGVVGSIESEIQAKGLTAPRVTPQQIEEVIAGEYYFTAQEGAHMAQRESEGSFPITETDWKALGLLTFCVLVLRNGFTVNGDSACASPENFNAEIGRKVARQKAIEKIWPLEGYLLRDRLAQAEALANTVNAELSGDDYSKHYSRKRDEWDAQAELDRYRDLSNPK